MDYFVHVVLLLFSCFRLYSGRWYDILNARSNGDVLINVTLNALPIANSSVYVQKKPNFYYYPYYYYYYYYNHRRRINRRQTIATLKGTEGKYFKNYGCRIDFSGNTTSGNIEFTMKNVTYADAAMYQVKYRAGNTTFYTYKDIYLVIDGDIHYAERGKDAVLQLDLKTESFFSSDQLIDPHGTVGSFNFYNWGGSFRMNIRNVTQTKYSIVPHIHNGTIQVTVKNVSSEDEGTYAFKKGLHGVQLVICVPPNKPVIAQKNRLVARTPLTLSCEATSNTVPDGFEKIKMKSEWFVDDKKIENDAKYRITSSSLTLTTVEKEDVGKRFSCRAHEFPSSPSPVSDDYNISLQFPPLITFSPTNISYTHSEGDTMNDVTCFADCLPECKYVWKTPSGDYITGSILSLGQLDRKKHGFYSCVASNDVGRQAKSIYVNLQYSTTIIDYNARCAGITMIVLSLLIVTGTICAVRYLKLRQVSAPLHTSDSGTQSHFDIILSNIRTLFHASETFKVHENASVSEAKENEDKGTVKISFGGKENEGYDNSRLVK